MPIVQQGGAKMEQRERERWEQFCRTGLISDYLEYRIAAGYSRRTPVEGLVPGEEEQDAAWDQGGGALGQKLGGA